jgi:hypothetical protein
MNDSGSKGSFATTTPYTSIVINDNFYGYYLVSVIKETHENDHE